MAFRQTIGIVIDVINKASKPLKDITQAQQALFDVTQAYQIKSAKGNRFLQKAVEYATGGMIKYNKRTHNFVKDGKTFIKTSDAMAAATGGFTTALEGMTSMLGSTVGNLVARFGPLAAALAPLATFAITGRTVQDSLLKVRTAAKLSSEDLELYTRLLGGYIGELGVGIEELSETLARAASLQLKSRKEAEAFILTTEKFASATGIARGESADLFAELVRVYNIPTDKLSGIASAFIDIAKSGKLTAGELEGVLQQSDVLIKTLGPSVIPSVLSASASFRDAGGDVGQLSNSLNEMVKTSSLAGERLRTFIGMQTGVSSTAIKSALEQGKVAEVTGLLSRAIKDLPQEQLRDFIDEYGELTGLTEESIRALTRLDTDSLDKLATSSIEAAKSGAALDQAWADSQASITKQLGKIWEAVKGPFAMIGAIIVNAVLPALTMTADVLSTISNWFSNLPKPVLDFIAAFSGILGVAAGAWAFLKAVRLIIPGLKLVGLLLAIPLGTVLAIAAAVAAVILVVTNWGWLMDNVILPVWEWIKTAATDVWGWIKKIVSFTVEWLTPIGYAKKTFEVLRDLIISFGPAIINTFSAVWETIKSGFTSVFSFAADGFKWLANSFIKGINWITEQINSVISYLPDWLGGSALQIPKIPELGSGGMVMPSPGGTVVKVAEQGVPEMIVPLDSPAITTLGNQDEVVDAIKWLGRYLVDNLQGGSVARAPEGRSSNSDIARNFSGI